MPKDERKSKNDRGKRNQRRKSILTVENEKEYKDNEYKGHSEQDSIKLRNSWANILGKEK